MKKIAFIGPESTGKSTLCDQLAVYFKTICVPEFARTYISELERPYTKDDVLHCIKMQINENKKAEINSDRLFFTDNETINGMIWMLDKFNSCPEWVVDDIKNNPFDLYLLTFPDIAFVSDSVRENGHRRMYFFEWYKNELESRNLNYAIIKGEGKIRFENAINAVEDFFNLKSDLS